ncbi:MAG: DUF6850 family outer membrane beta-barrel protein [Sphingobacterium sp.]
MFRFLISFFLTLAWSFSLPVNAQDSLSGSNVNHAEYVHSIFHRQVYDYMTKNQVWIGGEVLEGFNAIDLGFGHSKGKWIDAQGADNIRSLGVGTEGKVSLDKFTLWGKFRYDRIMEDSTSLRHQTRINNDAPIYFGSLRKNYYERDLYTLSAVGQYGLDDHRWPLTLGVDYRVGNHFSNNDPRGRVSDFQFDSYFGMGRDAEKWSLHVGGILGYGRERVSVGYKNEKHKENIADPLYINWYMNGFGRATMQLTNIDYNNDFQRYGGRINLSTSIGSWGKLFGTLEAVREKQHFKRYDTSPKTYQMLNLYTRDRYDLDLLWSINPSDHSATNISFQAGLVDGKDLNYDLMRKNYSYRQEYARIGFSQRSAPLEWTINAELASQSRNDGSMAIWQKNQYVEPSASVRYRFSLGSGNQQLAPSLSGGYRHAFGEELNFPRGVTGDFSESIILHDAAYHSTPSMIFGLGIDYQFRQNEKKAIGVNLNTQYRRRTQELPIDTAPNLPGLDRLESRISVGYYF